MDKAKTTKRSVMTELARRNQPSPEVLADWEKMAQAACDNLNRNVTEEAKNKTR